LTLIRNASRDSLEKLLPILDDFARAEQASKDALRMQKRLKEGQALIHTKFKQVMEAQGIQQIEVNPGRCIRCGFARSDHSNPFTRAQRQGG